MDRCALAYAYHKQGYNCAQSVAGAFGDRTGWPMAVSYTHLDVYKRQGMLNNVLADAQTRVQPPTDKGRRLKIYYMTQVGIRPPHFVVFCNDARLFHFSYQRYLENCIRNTFGLEGTPIILSIRQKGEKEG